MIVRVHFLRLKKCKSFIIRILFGCRETGFMISSYYIPDDLLPLPAVLLSAGVAGAAGAPLAL
jgi:hypothetical protein